MNDFFDVIRRPEVSKKVTTHLKLIFPNFACINFLTTIMIINHELDSRCKINDVLARLLEKEAFA